MSIAATIPTRREQQGAESRRKIVDAAGTLMSERGFAGTSISAVRRVSGLPSGSIYWHFKNKEALLSAVIEDAARGWLDALPGPDVLPAEPEERLSTLLNAAARALEERPEFLRLILIISLERGNADEASLATVRRARALARDRLTAAMREFLTAIPKARDRAALARKFAHFTLMVADGAFIAHHVEPEETDVHASLDLLRQALTAFMREKLASSASAPEPRRNRHRPTGGKRGAKSRK